MNKLQASKSIIPKTFWGCLFVFVTLVCIVSSELNDLNISSNNNEGDEVRVQARSEHICDEDDCNEEVSSSDDQDSVKLKNRHERNTNVSTDNTTLEEDNASDDSEHEADYLTTDITGIVTTTQKTNLAKQLLLQKESKRIPPSPVKPTPGNARRYYSVCNIYTKQGP